MSKTNPDRPHLSEQTRGVMLDCARQLGRQIGEDAPRLRADVAVAIGRAPTFDELQRVANAMMLDTMGKISAHVVDSGGSAADAEEICQALHDTIRDVAIGTRH